MIKFIFHKILGWKINGYSKLPVKCVLIAGPHTHWIDLFLGFAIRNSIGEDIRFIGKKVHINFGMATNSKIPEFGMKSYSPLFLEISCGSMDHFPAVFTTISKYFVWP